MITMLAAITVRGVIGVRGVNTLLWHSSIDMELFKNNTKGQTLVMGNNTFKSLRGPLKKRKNVILSKSEEPGKRNGAYYYNNMGDILTDFEDFIVIGGEAIYNLFLPITDEVILSSFSLDFEGNANYAYFPLAQLEKDFTMSNESDITTDTDTISGIPINIIFTRWRRNVPNVH